MSDCCFGTAERIRWTVDQRVSRGFGEVGGKHVLLARTKGARPFDLERSIGDRSWCFLAKQPRERLLTTCGGAARRRKALQGLRCVDRVLKVSRLRGRKPNRPIRRR